MKVAETKRLVLRDFVDADWKAVYDYASDAKVVRYMDWGPNTEEETREFIQRAIAYQNEKPRRHYDLAVVLKSQNTIVGGCGIHVSNPDNSEGWIGYLFSYDSWGKGYATETAKALLEFGFEKLNLHRIFATCDPANTASAHVMEKAGMKLEGHLVGHKWAKGKWRNSLLYVALNHGWEVSQP